MDEEFERKAQDLEAQGENQASRLRVVAPLRLAIRMAKRINYRKIAFQHYATVCAHCGFGIPSVLEVGHIDGNRRNNDLESRGAGVKNVTSPGRA